MSKTSKSFKDYYADPKYKAKHLEYMKEHIPCCCGTTTRRCNMSKHRKTSGHIKWIEENNIYKLEYLPKLKKLKQKVVKINNELKLLVKKIEKIK